MSRRKRSSAGRRHGPAAADPHHDAPADRPTRWPNPPRPSKPLLVATGLLLVVWIVFLLVLAIRT